jgi:hypothetical protein
VADLAATQRRMLAAIAGDGDAAAVVAGSAALCAQRRIEIYARGYRARLVGCLRDMYPGLRHALGAEVFEAFALDYLDAHPPSGYTLNALGARWPEHLEATRPQDERWPAFVVDLARLELAFHEVYDGEGVEGEPPLRGEDLRDGALRAAPCLRLLRARYPVSGYLGAVRRGEEPPLPAPRATYVAVTRRDFAVTLTELDAPDYAALERLTRGEPIDEPELLRRFAAAGFVSRMVRATSEVVR